jgi:L-threonylcarbamoyladenylate synthase
MTLILPRTELAKDYITGGQNNVGLRVPAQPIALALLKKFEDLGGKGVAAPSANRFGAVSPTTAEAVDEELGDYLDSADLVLDGGQCLVGIESTIVSCVGSTPVVLRPGSVDIEMIENVVGTRIQNLNAETNVKAPGMSKSHYSPRAKIFLNSISRKGDGFIALADVPTPDGAIRLCSPKNLEEFARDLYKSFREADKLGIKNIVIITPDGEGLAVAIMDRLIKSSTKL